MVTWINLGLVLGPVLVLVVRQCRAADLRPTLPLLGLLVGLLVEVKQ